MSEGFFFYQMKNELFTFERKLSFVNLSVILYCFEKNEVFTSFYILKEQFFVNNDGINLQKKIPF